MADRHRCTPFPGSGVAQASIDASCRGDEIDEQIAWTMGAINVAFGQLLLLTKAAMDEGLAGGHGLKPGDWLAWRTGLAKAQCNTILALAARADELPATVAAVTAGELTLDQAAPIARHVPAANERGACEFARSATVNQLNRSLSKFRFEPPEDPGKPKKQPEDCAGRVSKGRDDRGWRLDARLPDDEAAQFDQALAAAKEDLYQQRKADTPEDQPVAPVTAAEALCALAESYLANGQAARPGSDRYLVHLHLEAGTDGPVLANHLGVAIDEATRRMILCDCSIRVTTWEGHNPLSVGRKHHVVTRRMRRAIEHRDGGCAAPGCTRTAGLHIHHIVHWEDGGRTDTDNLVTLCNTHHQLHHRGLLGINRMASTPAGNAGWVAFTDADGRPLDASGKPRPKYAPAAHPGGRPATRTAEGRGHDPHHDPLAPWTPASHAHQAVRAIDLDPQRYQCASGERFNLKDLTLGPDRPPPDHASPPDPDADPRPDIGGGTEPPSGCPPSAPRFPAGGLAPPEADTAPSAA